MPIEIKELTIKTTVTPATHSTPDAVGIDADEMDRLKDEIKEMCKELIEEFLEKKSRR